MTSRLRMAAAVIFLLVAPAPARPAAAAGGITSTALREWMFENQRGWRALLGGDLARAEASFRAAIQVVRPFEADDPRLLARSYCDLARVLYHQERYAQAEPLAKWSLSVREKYPRVSGDAVFQSLYVLAMIDRELKRYDEAERLLRRALANRENALGPGDFEVALIADALAGTLRDQGKHAESEQLYKRALDIFKRVFPDDHPEVAETSEHYAALLRKMDRLTEAEFLEARARTIRAEAGATARAQAEEDARNRAGQFRSRPQGAR